MKSRSSLIKIMSYLNYFRCLQKNLNLSYVELLLGYSIETTSTQSQPASAARKPSDPSAFDPANPLDVQHEKINAKNYDEKFFLTNPSLAQYGNFSQLGFNGKNPSRASSSTGSTYSLFPASNTLSP